MAYCEVEDVRAVLSGPRGTDERLSPNSLDDDQIQYAIASATAQINSALQKRYVLPPTINGVVVADIIVNVPLLYTLAVEISRYVAMVVYRSGGEFVNALDASVQGYTRALSLLSGLQDGTVELNIDELGSGTNADDAATVFNQYDGPLFPSHWIFDAPEGTIPGEWQYR